MPEGPELYLAAEFINTVSKNRLYGGQVVKSEVSTKNPDVEWSCQVYRVRAQSRGKELKVTLMEGQQEEKETKELDIVFRFGMSGSFKFTAVDETPKHAHLRFYTINEAVPMVLSFVDYRRFGRWEVEGSWGADRGPDPMWDYPTFRENVLASLSAPAFSKPICEAMLNQKYFNGIGNYLRAEILYRCGIPPFDEAREVLHELKPFSQWWEIKAKVKATEEVTVKPDFLDLCHIVPKEVINLSGGGKGYNVDPDADDDEYASFREWLQCYYQDGMRNLVDHNRRTIWFSGEPGRLKPKESTSRGKVERKKKGKKSQDSKPSTPQHTDTNSTRLTGVTDKPKRQTRQSRQKTLNCEEPTIINGNTSEKTKKENSRSSSVAKKGPNTKKNSGTGKTLMKSVSEEVSGGGREVRRQSTRASRSRTFSPYFLPTDE